MRRMQAVRPRPTLAHLAIVLSLALRPDPGSAQQQTLAELTASPEEAAVLFLRSVRAIRWSAAAQFLHASTLERFHRLVTMMAEADTTGGVREYLTGTDTDGYAALDAATVFDRAVGTMIDDMPGLMHALFDRDDDVLGHVSESPDTAHVVYRSTPRLSGAVSEVKVMQAVHTPGGWRILWSDELEVLDTALRGIPRARRDDDSPSRSPPAASASARFSAPAVASTRRAGGPRCPRA